MDTETARNAVFVSCDIVSHGDDPDHARQLERIKSLNACVAEACAGRFGKDVIWASGGDGGHVASFSEDKCALALQLVGALYCWARDSRLGFDNGEIKLRLTAHYGPASVIRGADGRNELVGDGINACGSLLKFGKSGAVLASGAFRDLCESLQAEGGLQVQVHFGREQHVYLKHDRAALIMPMAIEGVLVLPESVRTHPEKSRLDGAMAHGRFWSAIYHAKRLLQVDSADAHAINSLQQITPSQLVLAARGGDRVEAHPLLSALNRQAMQDLIRASQLVEREDGETICSQDDPGDAMFIVLKGAIGVVLEAPPADAPAHGPPPSIKFGEGQIVGELALALNRKRTATLQAIGPTAFLSINYDILRGLMDAGPQTARLQRVFSDFLLQRSLRFLCQNCSYLAGGPDAPLAGVSEPWETLADDAEQFKLNWQEAEARLASPDRFSAPGIYILAGGALAEATQNDVVPKKLHAAELPLVCVNLPKVLVGSHHPYQLDPEAGGSIVNVVRISDRSLKAFGPAIFSRLVEALRRTLAAQFFFDVFISYTNRDEGIAGAWREALQKAGFRVYMSRPDAMRKFKKEIELALAESLVMVPFVSDRAAGPDGQKGWVQREIEYRKTLFDEDHCNILPIELTRGLAAVFADGFSAVTVTGEGLDQFSTVVEAIEAVKSGAKQPPYAALRETIAPI